jgi:hypothetical protein
MCRPASVSIERTVGANAAAMIALVVSAGRHTGRPQRRRAAVVVGRPTFDSDAVAISHSDTRSPPTEPNT